MAHARGQGRAAPRRGIDSLPGRLLVGLAAPLVLFLVVGLVSGFVITGLLAALRNEKRTQEVINQALLLTRHLEAMRFAFEAFGPAGLGRSQYFQTARTEFARLGQELPEKVADNPAQRKEAQEILDDEARLLALLMRQGGAGEAQALFVQLEGRIVRFIEAEQEVLRERRAWTEAQARQSNALIAPAVGLGTVLALVLALAAARSVTRPVDRLREAAGQLVSGHYQSVPPEGPTEIAELIVLFNHMALTLSLRTSLLEKQHERYQTWIGALAHILWTTDAAGLVTGELPTWQAFTGQTREEVRGVGWMQAIHPEDRDRAIEAWRAAVATRGVYAIDFRLRSAAGLYRHFSCRGVPVQGADGSVHEWIGTCTDVTEEKQRQALVQDKETAEQANQAKSEFLTRMSHELRTPLNAVIGMSRMLATQRFGPLNAKQSDYLADIGRAGEHLLALINDILDLSKVEAGKMEVQADAFEPAAAIEGLAGTLRPLAELRGVHLRLAEGVPTGEVQTDPARFRQVLYNLLSNAIKFTPAGGSVCVRWEWVEGPRLDSGPADPGIAGALRVAVEDTGIGIAPEEQEVIWDEFRQGRRQPGEEPQGTGLGLALTRRLVGLLGGQVGLVSAVGSGSTFTFVLPRCLPESIEDDPAEPAGVTDRPIAVVIEDHPPTNKLLCDWLSGAGLAPVAALDGRAGLEKARQLAPGLIILDINLPGLDGWQVLTELKSDSRTARTPVVVVTVDEQRRPTSSFAVQEFFVKPVDREVFLDRLRGLVPHLVQPDRPRRILIVEDDGVTGKLIGDMLHAQGVEVISAADGSEALARLREGPPELMLLDLTAPEVDGFAVIDQVRSCPELAGLPIVVLTARDLWAGDRERLQGQIQALWLKHLLTPERLREHLTTLGLLCRG